MNVIFTCGGTAGHINPAIAVANILKERHPDVNILFIGAKGHMEEKLVPKAGYELKCLPGSGLSRSISFAGLKKNVKALKNVLSAVGQCKKFIREFQADVVVGTGGYASFPALHAASKLGIPTIVHEANAVPGLTTKMAAKTATRVLVAFEESAQYYKKPEKVEVVGMPVCKEFVLTEREAARKELGLDSRPLVVSAFGSLGARAMNYAMADFMKLEQADGMPFQHIHATGSYGWAWMPDHLKEQGIDHENCSGLDMREYIYNMPTVMAAADVIISRAGASTLNEIGASGTPCILIPSPNVTNDHQTKNAKVLADRGGAVLIPEGENMGKQLYDTVTELLADHERRSHMSAQLRQLVVLDSAQRICDMIEELAAGENG
ncbi:MAG: undecaprenyldiphospho-muramoylpentapeptide beta-N-acetylglucosaminyltransferase [Oscillospiraceae bacterium]|nr:undecaprenyldiphospho-muramoylpentapeptide beta-N-acetylglucosaminyltransferase [Oscillospiraceae bacterium]